MKRDLQIHKRDVDTSTVDTGVLDRLDSLLEAPVATDEDCRLCHFSDLYRSLFISV